MLHSMTLLQWKMHPVYSADYECSARKIDAFQLDLFLDRDLTIDQRQRLFCLASFSTTVLIFHCCAIDNSVFVTQ